MVRAEVYGRARKESSVHVDEDGVAGVVWVIECKRARACSSDGEVRAKQRADGQNVHAKEQGGGNCRPLLAKSGLLYPLWSFGDRPPSVPSLVAAVRNVLFLPQRETPALPMPPSPGLTGDGESSPAEQHPGHCTGSHSFSHPHRCDWLELQRCSDCLRTCDA